MTKKCLLILTAVAVSQGMFLTAPKPASAILPFMKEFTAKYVNKESTDPKDQAFASAVKSAKCYVCHKGKKKKDRNVYGDALSKLLDKKKDKKNKEKIRSALEKVAKLKSDPKDEKSPTFGELIEQGKLPGGKPKKSRSN